VGENPTLSATGRRWWQKPRRPDFLQTRLMVRPVCSSFRGAARLRSSPCADVTGIKQSRKAKMALRQDRSQLWHSPWIFANLRVSCPGTTWQASPGVRNHPADGSFLPPFCIHAAIALSATYIDAARDPVVVCAGLAETGLHELQRLISHVEARVESERVHLRGGGRQHAPIVHPWPCRSPQRATA